MSRATDPDNGGVLFKIATDSDLTTDEKIESVLDLGRERLGTENAHLVRVDPEDGNHKVLHAVGSDLVEAAAETPVSETFCRKTIDTEGLFVVHDAPAEGLGNDPAYERWDIACYLGGRIELTDGAYTTVCFVDETPRDDSFSPTERSFADRVVRWIRLLLERHRETDDPELSDPRLEQFTRDVSEYAILTLDTDGRITTWNDGAAQLTGYGSEEAAGMHFSTLHTDEDRRAGLPDQLLSAAREQGTVEHEGWRVNNDGTRIWALVTITAIYRDGGSFDGYGVIVRDLSEVRTPEQALGTQRSITQEMIDAFEDLFVVIGVDGTLHWVNERGIELSGVPRDRISTVDVFEFVAPEDRPKVEAAIDEAGDEGESTTEVTIVTPENEQFQYEFRTIGLTDESGTLDAVAAVGRDITERNLHEQRLEVTSRVLRHNLRNDITAIKGWATEIADGSAEDPQAAASLIVEMADELMDLSEKARTMAEIGPVVRDDHGPVDVADCAREVAAAFQSFATIDVRIEEASAVTVGDRELLLLALRNAVENAIEHSPDADPWVGLAVSTTGASIRVEIEDTCAPIPEDERDVLARGAESPLEHGSGLGLWLLQWAVTVLGGSIDIEDRDPGGNRVVLTLPRTEHAAGEND